MVEGRDARAGRAARAEVGSDRWFREQGLPTFVPLRRWFVDLPRRTAPLVVLVTTLIVLGGGSGVVLEAVIAALADVEATASLTRDAYDWIVVAIVGAAALLVVGIAVVLALLAQGLLRRMRAAAGTATAAGILVAFPGMQIVEGYDLDAGATVSPVLGALAVVLGCVLVTGMGGGALVAWASRLAVRNAAAVVHMASIALPVILMVVIFAFFSAEVWQMTAAIGWGSLLLVAAVVGALALLAVLRVAAHELDELRGETGAAAAPAGADAVPSPFGRWQRLNVLFVMAIAQLAQAALFALLLAALLVVLGAIVIPRDVVDLWVGAELEVERLRVGGLTLPLTTNLLKSAMLLATIAALPFVFSAVSEARYRERFFDPIMDELRHAIAVRRDQLARPEPTPATARRRRARAPR